MATATESQGLAVNGRPNQPQTLTGIETNSVVGYQASSQRPNQPQTLTGIETDSLAAPGFLAWGPINLKPLQGLKRYISTRELVRGLAQSTSNPYRD